MIRYCYKCEAEQEVRVTKMQETFTVKGVPIETVSDVVVCQTCGEKLFDEQLDQKNMLRLYAKYHNTQGLSDEKIEHLIAQVDATFAIEGMPLTERDKVTLRKYAKGEINIHQIIKEALAEFGKKEGL